MTDAELLELYAIYVDAFTANMTLMISLMFAFIVAIYVSAKKLNGFQFYLTTGLFVIFSLSAAMGARDTCARAVSLQSEIARRISMEGSQISYVSVDGMPAFLPSYVMGVSVLAILLAAGFGVSHRRRKKTVKYESESIG